MSLDSFKVKFFENQSKVQAAKIVDLEVKVAYLERKVAFLEGRLKEEEQAKNATSAGPRVTQAAAGKRPENESSSEPVGAGSSTVVPATDPQAQAMSPLREPLLAISQKRLAWEKLADLVSDSPATPWSTGEQPPSQKKMKHEHEDGPSNLILSTMIGPHTYGPEVTTSSTHADDPDSKAPTQPSAEAPPAPAHVDIRLGPQAAIATASSSAAYIGYDSDDTDISSTDDSPRIKDRLKMLQRVSTPDLVDSLQNIMVSREELNQYPWFIDPNSICVHQYTRSFLFPSYARNPLLPKRAGKPGLIYWANDTPLWEEHQGPYALLVGYKGQFQYFGEYRLRRSRALSTDEYGTWSHNLKDLWAESILRFSPFEDVRARFVEPPEEDSSDEEQSEQEELRGKERRKVKRAIIDAYEQGTEKIRVWSMECIRFDDVFLQELQHVLDK
ncbi:hypothetical protein C8Q79DRAFT_1015187 [Trametes meyenii]|nr:hypothetical protein C8Q79DRAFT_1015187 [Trametes meyenii]